MDELKPEFNRLGRDDQNDDYMVGYSDGWNECIEQLINLATKRRIAIS